MRIELKEDEVAALKKARKAIDDADEELNEEILGTMQLRSKINSIVNWMDALMGAFGIDRCGRCGEELQTYDPSPDFPDEEPDMYCPNC